MSFRSLEIFVSMMYHMMMMYRIKLPAFLDPLDPGVHSKYSHLNTSSCRRWGDHHLIENLTWMWKEESRRAPMTKEVEEKIIWIRFSRNLQIHPKPPDSFRFLQIPSDSFRFHQKHPGSSRNLQIPPETFWSLQKHTDPFRNLQINPDSSTIIQIHPQTSRIIQNHPDSSRNLKFHP